MFLWGVHMPVEAKGVFFDYFPSSCSRPGPGANGQRVPTVHLSISTLSAGVKDANTAHAYIYQLSCLPNLSWNLMAFCL